MLLKAFWFSHHLSIKKGLSDIHPSHWGTRTTCIPLSSFQLLSPPQAYFEQEPAEETRHEGKPNKHHCNDLFPPSHMISSLNKSYIISKLEAPLKGQDIINHYTVKTVFAISFSSINNVLHISKTKNILQSKCYSWQNRQTPP